MTAPPQRRTAPGPGPRLDLASVTDLLAALEGPTAASGATKQRQTLDAALELFAAYGFESVGMRQLADRVGLSAPGLYAHFSSKEAIIAAAMKHALARFLKAVLVPIHQEAEHDRLDGLISRHVRFQLENLPITKANDQLLDSSSMRLYLPAQDYDILVRAQRVYSGVLRQLIQAEAPSASTEQVRLAAFAILAMCERVTTWYRQDGNLTVDQVADEYCLLARSQVTSLEGAP